MGSTRLPGKTLTDLHGKPLLQRVIERSRASHWIDEIVVATTTERCDDEIAGLCASLQVVCCRGSVADVLDRYYQAAIQTKADVVVRITADDPFKDPQVIDCVVGRFLADQLDYASNTIVPTYPEGLDVEVFDFSALRCSWQEAILPSEREHVTPYIWKNPDHFRVANVVNDEDLSHLRWTIDYQDDLIFAREVYARFDTEELFVMRDILTLLEREPEIGNLVKHIKRNQGYLASLEQDRATK